MNIDHAVPLVALGNARGGQVTIKDSRQPRRHAEEGRRGRQPGRDRLPDRRYAVIVDEAHSSQSGESATELKGVLAANSIKEKAKEEAEAQGLTDHEKEILKTMLKRGR